MSRVILGRPAWTRQVRACARSDDAPLAGNHKLLAGGLVHMTSGVVMQRRSGLAWVLATVLVAAAGCSSKPAVKPDSVVAKQKLDAITRLADALAKNPAGVDAIVAMDEFNNLSYNPSSQPETSQ